MLLGTLPVLLFQLPFKIPPILIQIYGEEQPNRWWYILMTVCVLLLCFKNYRRFAGIALISLAFMMFVWNGLNTMYKDYTPKAGGGTPPPKRSRYKWEN